LLELPLELLLELLSLLPQPAIKPAPARTPMLANAASPRGR
jgi:hypothetical protein